MQYINPKNPNEEAYTQGWEDANNGLIIDGTQRKELTPEEYDWWECGYVDNPKSESLIN